MNQQEDVKDTDTEHGNRMSTRDLVGSVLSAAFGVQSSRNRERDFSQGNYRQFIIAGVIFTVLFVTTLVVVVNIVLG